MSVRAQIALLRFLKDQEYRPIGGAIVKDANVRVVASGNADLRAMAQAGAFRTDLDFGGGRRRNRRCSNANS
jgi:DNA-binding NtrC family response regulator